MTPQNKEARRTGNASGLHTGQRQGQRRFTRDCAGGSLAGLQPLDNPRHHDAHEFKAPLNSMFRMQPTLAHREGYYTPLAIHFHNLVSQSVRSRTSNNDGVNDESMPERIRQGARHAN